MKGFVAIKPGQPTTNRQPLPHQPFQSPPRRPAKADFPGREPSRVPHRLSQQPLRGHQPQRADCVIRGGQARIDSRNPAKPHRMCVARTRRKKERPPEGGLSCTSIPDETVNQSTATCAKRGDARGRRPAPSPPATWRRSRARARPERPDRHPP